MKIKALILLVGALAYVGGWLVMPGLMGKAAAVSYTSCKMCCEKSINACDHSRYPKPGKGNNGTANCCLDCPLCYTTILPFVQEESGPVTITKKLYPAYQSSYLYGFHADTWKPPNSLSPNGCAA